MAMPLDLVLVRHGESVGNVAIHEAKSRRSMASSDEQHPPRRWVLTPTGRAQAEAAGAWLRGHGLDIDHYDRCYCSPYVRTLRFAACAFPSGRHVPNPSEAVVEITLGRTQTGVAWG